MEVEAAKLISAGLATIGVAGSGAGMGTVFGAYVSGIFEIHLRHHRLLVGYC